MRATLAIALCRLQIFNFAKSEWCKSICADDPNKHNFQTVQMYTWWREGVGAQTQLELRQHMVQRASLVQVCGSPRRDQMNAIAAWY